jgi:DNA-binding XRE family transcriptional regulator
MTQECLAELAGVHFKTIGSIERGKYPFAVTTFVRLAQHLKVEADSLLAGVPEPDAVVASKTLKALARRRT